jgi:hypothetical protein
MKSILRHGSLVAALAGLTALPVHAQAGIAVRAPGASTLVSADKVPFPLPEIHVNLPAYRLEVWKDGQRVYSMPIGIGSRARPTPAGEFEIEEIVWNQRPTERVRLDVVGSFDVVGAGEAVRLGAPGATRDLRIRNADAIDIAMLLQRSTGVAVEGWVDGLIRSSYMPRTFHLPERVRVIVDYRLTEISNGYLEVHPDVYRKSRQTPYQRALAALEAAGYGARQLDTALLRKLLRRPTGTVRIDIESLILGPSVLGTPVAGT